MRNKGLVVFLTIVVTLLCIYYLSFTFISRNIQQKATEYARLADGSVSYSKKQAYLDSVWREPVIDIFGIQYTYQDIKETELNLGLDLQGGMHVTLEVSPVEILKGLAGVNATDPAFQKAIDLARERRAESQERFISLFYEAWREQKGAGELKYVFANAANRGRISLQSSDDEILAILRDEVESAIDRSFQILRTRVDRFGTTQPNIQRLQGTGRIQVELPGADNPERVRKLLQGTAKLEFLEVVEINEYINALQQVNDKLVAESRAKKIEGTTTSEDALSGKEDEVTSPEAESLPDMLKDDADTVQDGDLAEQLGKEGAKGADSLDLQVSPLFSLLKSNGGLVYELRDTAQINKIFAREDVQSMLPANLDFVWSVKPVTPKGSDLELLELHAVQRGRGGEAPLTGEVITDARQDFDERGRVAVSMNMNSEGAKIWKRLTGNNVNERIAIVLDNYVYSAPSVSGEIPNGTSSITGAFSVEEAKDLANILKAGALPAPARIVEEAIVGPTLGQKAQSQGILSIVAGLGIVVIFIVMYYAKGGLVANLALLFNIFFIFGILAQLNAALTLPGIAGIVLTIGMSIDANVLIFERIREELRNGAGLKQAISAGYNKAYSSIIDANVTTLLVAIFLYVLGQGPVKGFAITLMIGIICSLFSAVLITRVIIEWMAKKENASISFDTGFSRNWFKGINADFLGKRKVAYIFSSIFIVIGIAVMFMQGGLNMGVDFTGGRSYVVAFTEPVPASDLKVALADDFGGSGVEVKTYGSNNILKVTTGYRINEEDPNVDAEVQDKLIAGVKEFRGGEYVEDGRSLDGKEFSIISSSKVGATIADDIVDSSWESALFSLIAIFIYILVRFNKWQYSAGAVVALFHDVLFTIAAFSIAGALGFTYEVDQVFVAAILTIIGYSINDTVVVFDRLRENYANPYIKGTIIEQFNGAINNTLNRTIMTSLTTLIVVLVLLFFGGEVLKGFAFALFIGILVGTYSSIFIATPVVVDLMGDKEEAKVARQAV